MPVFATKSTFERLRLKNKNVVKVDVDAQEFQTEYKRQLWLFTNYKWTLGSIPNGMFVTYLLPKRFPIILRGSVGYAVLALGYWGHRRGAHNRTVELFKKKMIMQHVDTSSEIDSREKELMQRKLFGDESFDG